MNTQPLRIIALIGSISGVIASAMTAMGSPLVSNPVILIIIAIANVIHGSASVIENWKVSNLAANN